MEIKEISEIAKKITGKINSDPECEKGNCQYNKDVFCCEWGAQFKIETFIRRGIEEGIRKEATTLPPSADDKKKYNVQLQHDGHNQLDRLTDALYRFDKFNKETKPGTVSFVTAEYIRTAIKDLRHVLNELYLNNKTTTPQP